MGVQDLEPEVEGLKHQVQELQVAQLLQVVFEALPLEPDQNRLQLAVDYIIPLSFGNFTLTTNFSKLSLYKRQPEAKPVLF